ncbi:MAG: efflux RND transporter periplasmic adaptor subunit [Planctomycetota bacterium]|jgi:HlyD family secretion protein
MRSVRWIIYVLIAGAVIAAITLAMRPHPVPVLAAEIAASPMQLTVDEEGKTRLRERYIVSTPLMGRLRRITLDPGDRVMADETVLAVLEPTDPALLDPRALAEAEARVRAAEAAVRHADAKIDRLQVAYDFAEKELGRLVSAMERGAASEHELDGAKLAESAATQELKAGQFFAEIAEYELEVARAALVFARGDTGEEGIGQMDIDSPIDGVVLRVFQESAAVVTPGASLMEIGDPRDLELVIDVLSTDAVRIQPGARVIIDHWGGSAPLEGAVRLVEPSAFTKISALGIEEQRVNVIADLVSPPDQRASLGDGFRIEAAIVVWEANDVLQVPTSAVFRVGEDWAVYAIEAERAVARMIQAGRRDGRTTQVLGGLKPGDRVVRHPTDAIADGVRVRVRAD